MMRAIRLQIWFLIFCFCSKTATAFLRTRASWTGGKFLVVEMGGENDEEVYTVANTPERQNTSPPSPPAEAMNYMDEGIRQTSLD